MLQFVCLRIGAGGLEVRGGDARLAPRGSTPEDGHRVLCLKAERREREEGDGQRRPYEVQRSNVAHEEHSLTMVDGKTESRGLPKRAFEPCLSTEYVATQLLDTVENASVTLS